MVRDGFLAHGTSGIGGEEIGSLALQQEKNITIDLRHETGSCSMD